MVVEFGLPEHYSFKMAADWTRVWDWDYDDG